MSPLLAALLAALAPAASAAPASFEVRRGDLELRVKVGGTVVPGELFRLKSTVEGRVESVLVSSNAWRREGQPLALLAHRELAALIDARGTQDQEILENRWQRVYKPTPIKCASTCFVLKVFAKPKTWVKPQALLFEVADGLNLVARVRPEDAHLVRDGQLVDFWPRNDPKKVRQGKVSRFVLDVQGQDVDPGGTFSIELTPDKTLDPGTEWEGSVLIERRRNALYVPTAALIRHGSAAYLPVRVSTGVTTAEFTEITAGVEAKRPALALDDAALKGAGRHAPVPDRPALRRRAAELSREPEPEPEEEPRRREPEYYGEDPYAD